MRFDAAVPTALYLTGGMQMGKMFLASVLRQLLLASTFLPPCIDRKQEAKQGEPNKEKVLLSVCSLMLGQGCRIGLLLSRPLTVGCPGSLLEQGHSHSQCYQEVPDQWHEPKA